MRVVCRAAPASFWQRSLHLKCPLFYFSLSNHSSRIRGMARRRRRHCDDVIAAPHLRTLLDNKCTHTPVMLFAYTLLSRSTCTTSNLNLTFGSLLLLRRERRQPSQTSVPKITCVYRKKKNRLLAQHSQSVVLFWWSPDTKVK